MHDMMNLTIYKAPGVYVSRDEISKIAMFTIFRFMSSYRKKMDNGRVYVLWIQR